MSRDDGLVQCCVLWQHSIAETPSSTNNKCGTCAGQRLVGFISLLCHSEEAKCCTDTTISLLGSNLELLYGWMLCSVNTPTD